MDCSPIFICGSVRSGTTLLQFLLNAHPKIAIFGELHYFDQILQVRQFVPDIEKDYAFDRFLRLIQNADNYKYIPNANKFFQLVEKRFKMEKYRSYEHFFRCVLEEYARTQGAVRFGEKTPTNIRYLDRLLDIFPKAKIIHIIRDPRSAVASSISMPWTSSVAVVNAMKWKCDILYSRVFNRTDMSYLEVRYEDIVCDTESQLRRICRFIGENYDDEMKEFYKSSRTYIKNEPWKERTLEPINESAVNRWRWDLSGPQIFLIEKIVGDLLNDFGYKLAKLPLRAKLISPFVFVLELLKYAQYKYKDIKVRRTDHSHIIFGEKERLYRMFFKTIFR
jgi:hypothetical protein